MNEKRCPSCGASIDFNATECKYCGEQLAVQPAQEPQYQPPQPQQYQPQSQPKETNSNYSEYAYLKPYYQIEFEKISSSNETYKGRFNWCAFFFTWIWGFTKGLWQYALATIIIYIIIESMDTSLTWLSLIICIVWGIKGNYWYYKNLNGKNGKYNR